VNGEASEPGATSTDENRYRETLQAGGKLKEFVGKSNESVLSIEVMKKTNEIEELVHSVKEKMRRPN
jgi:hypothetical protein